MLGDTCDKTIGLFIGFVYGKLYLITGNDSDRGDYSALLT
jgi:hypothetical protein